MCFSSDIQVIHCALLWSEDVGGKYSKELCDLFPATQEICDRGTVQISGRKVLGFNQKRSLLCLSDSWGQLSCLLKPKRGKTLHVDPLVS